jgi:cephalosporin-C deacetylase-like acetyl esterase
MLAAVQQTAPHGDGDHSISVTDPVEVESFDGTTIVATLYEPEVSEPQPAVITTHGWGGTRADREPLARFYASHGYVVLAYDSRGFGASGGQVDVDGPNEVGDAQALLTWLAGRENVVTDGEEDPRVAMDGFSYGGGIQLNTAAEDDRIDALPTRTHPTASSRAGGPGRCSSRGGRTATSTRSSCNSRGQLSRVVSRARNCSRTTASARPSRRSGRSTPPR